MSRLLLLTTHGAALGTAVIGGSLFAFSSFVMPALARLHPSAGIAAMQAINVTAVTRSFIPVFLGTAVACAVLVTLAATHPDRTALLRGAGALLYLAGTFALTLAVHVPRNDALARLDPATVEAAAQWKIYIASWSSWNHVRTAAALLGAVVLVWSTRGDRP
jgi:uncharacterized membrane protein